MDAIKIARFVMKARTASNRPVRVALNGCGRIGRALLRLWATSYWPSHWQLVAVNDPHDPAMLCHLLNYDSTWGRSAAVFSLRDGQLGVADQDIWTVLCHERDPSVLPWRRYDVDFVLECTGRFVQREQAALHLSAGAKRVLLSAPGCQQVDATIVYGVNEHELSEDQQVVSIGSCTTNALAPLLKVLQDQYEIDSGMVTTIHAYTSDQRLLDNHHKDWRRARSAGASIIPTKTGAAAAIGQVLPALVGRLDGYALRVPTMNVSALEVTLHLRRMPAGLAQLHALYAKYSVDYPNVLQCSDQPLVSVDYNQSASSCVLDCLQTRQIGQQLRLFAWYDNEWGFAHRMIDVLASWSLICSEVGVA